MRDDTTIHLYREGELVTVRDRDYISDKPLKDAGTIGIITKIDYSLKKEFLIKDENGREHSFSRKQIRPSYCEEMEKSLKRFIRSV